MDKIPLASRLAVDATFKSSPGQFYQVIIIISSVISSISTQLLIVNGFIGNGDTGVWAPLFYALMPRKTRQDYARAYRGISEVR